MRIAGAVDDGPHDGIPGVPPADECAELLGDLDQVVPVRADGDENRVGRGARHLKMDVEPATVCARDELDEEEVFVVVMAWVRHATGVQIFLDPPFMSLPTGRVGPRVPLVLRNR